MISVIILTKNQNYSVLTVPENGRLVIMERHLIAGIIQNGVQVIPYGVNNPLIPFETFIMNNDMSIDMIPHYLYQEEGRILDFSALELLQAQFTVNPVDSGTKQEFTPIVYYDDNGLAINYNIKMKGATFADLAEAREWFKFFNTPTGNNFALDTTVVNGYKNEGLYQYLSVHFLEGHNGLISGRKFQNTGITEFYDLNGIIKNVSTNTLDSSLIEVAEFNGCTEINAFAITGAPNLSILKMPKLVTIGATHGNDFTEFTGFNKLPLGVKMTVSDFLRTCNNGAVEGDLQVGISNRNLEVTFI